jgi:hypothetical protein
MSTEGAGGSGGITKSEMRIEMRCIIQELMGLGSDWCQGKCKPQTR